MILVNTWLDFTLLFKQTSNPGENGSRNVITVYLKTFHNFLKNNLKDQIVYNFLYFFDHLI